jgi:hypothetical protein
MMDEATKEAIMQELGDRSIGEMHIAKITRRQLELVIAKHYYRGVGIFGDCVSGGVRGRWGDDRSSGLV